MFHDSYGFTNFCKPHTSMNITSQTSACFHNKKVQLPKKHLNKNIKSINNLASFHTALLKSP